MRHHINERIAGVKRKGGIQKLWWSWSGESVGGREEVECVVVYPGRLK